MTEKHTVRVLARRFLPPSLRRPLGAFCGRIYIFIVLPLLGMVFDLCGGKFRANGCVFDIPKKVTQLGFRACFLTGEFEQDERRLIPKYILPTDTVLELGGCLGIVSCITNKLLNEPRRHVVVEANPFCLPAIHRNRNLNHCGFLIESCAISNSKDLTFYLHPRYVVGGSVSNQAGIPVRVPGKTIGELCERYGPFSTLIMDIEGAELEAFESLNGRLKDFRLVIVELHEAAIGAAGLTRCRKLLENAGFKKMDESYITEVWQKV